jgi:hypothetical protein
MKYSRFLTLFEMTESRNSNEGVERRAIEETTAIKTKSAAQSGNAF